MTSPDSTGGERRAAKSCNRNPPATPTGSASFKVTKAYPQDKNFLRRLRRQKVPATTRKFEIAAYFTVEWLI
jgi:hypothetical protein